MIVAGELWAETGFEFVSDRNVEENLVDLKSLNIEETREGVHDLFRAASNEITIKWVLSICGYSTFGLGF